MKPHSGSIGRPMFISSARTLRGSTRTSGRRCSGRRARKVPESVVSGLNLADFVATVRGHVEACRYNLALQSIVQDFLTPTNQYLETNAPWKLVKTDKEAAKRVLFNAVQSLRVASILLKPFIPRSAETVYRGFNFPTPWEEVKHADAAQLRPQAEDLRVLAE